MTVQQTINCAADPACAQAVERFAGELRRLTSLRVALTEMEADILLDDEPAQKTLVAQWSTSDEDAGGAEPAFDEERPEEADPDDRAAGRDHLLEHYARALDALAANPPLARAFLARVR